MITLALRSIPQHRGAAFAAGLVAIVGTALVTAMTALLATGLASSTAHGDRAFLTQFPIILGGWVLAIVVFAMVSTVGVALQGRAGEIAGIRLIGATPFQVQSLITIETAVITSIAAVPGTGIGYLLGWTLFESVRASGLTHDSSAFAPGVLLPVLGASCVVIASIVAALIGSKAVALRDPVAGDIPAIGSSSRRGKDHVRRIAASLTIAAGVTSSLTVLTLAPTNILTTALTGPGCVLIAVGSCILAPELVAVGNRVLARVPWLGTGGAAHLATTNLAVAPFRIRPVVTFLTLFTGVAAGTLGMQQIENSVGVADSTGRVLASINYLVVVLIGAFMAIALVNNVVASVGQRRAELGAMHLIGSTSRQTRSMLLRETSAAVAVSLVAGIVGAAVSTVPFAIAKTGNALNAFAMLPSLGVILVGAALTLGVTAIAANRAMRTA
jgi:putative ABC transport system permease protein